MFILFILKITTVHWSWKNTDEVGMLIQGRSLTQKADITVNHLNSRRLYVDRGLTEAQVKNASGLEKKECSGREWRSLLGCRIWWFAATWILCSLRDLSAEDTNLQGSAGVCLGQGWLQHTVKLEPPLFPNDPDEPFLRLLLYSEAFLSYTGWWLVIVTYWRLFSVPSKQAGDGQVWLNKGETKGIQACG